MAPRVAPPDPLLVLPVALAMEFLIGLVIGLTAAVIVHGVGLAGQVLAMQMGLSLGEAVSPLSDVQVPGVGQIKSVLALMIYVGVGGHLVLLQGVAASLETLPPGVKISLDEGTALTVSLLGSFYMIALRTAAPAMVALLLTNTAVAITSRAVPQLHAILVLFPVNIGVGLIMLGAALPMIASTLTGWMDELPEKVLWALTAFRPSPWGI
jgi:flagellar biosynthetic protein FliR